MRELDWTWISGLAKSGQEFETAHIAGLGFSWPDLISSGPANRTRKTQARKMGQY